MTVHLIYCFRLQAVKGNVSTYFQVTKRYKEVIIRTPTSFYRPDLGEDNNARYYTGMEQKHKRLRITALAGASQKEPKGFSPRELHTSKIQIFKAFI